MNTDTDLSGYEARLVLLYASRFSLMEFKSHRIGGAMRQAVNNLCADISRVFIFESFVIVSRLHLFEYYSINHIITINQQLLIIIIENDPYKLW